MTEAAAQTRAGAPRGLSGHFEEVIACTAMAVVVGSVGWGVFTRYVTAQAATWSAEIAAVAFCWMIFLGSAAAFKRGLHVSIDMLTGILPPPLRRGIAVAVDLLVLGFLAWVSQLAISFTIDSWDTPMPSLRWPYSIHYAGAALGFVLMTLRHGVAAWGRWRRADA